MRSATRCYARPPTSAALNARGWRCAAEGTWTETSRVVALAALPALDPREHAEWDARLREVRPGTTTPLLIAAASDPTQGVVETIVWRCEDDRAGVLTLAHEASLDATTPQGDESDERAAFLVALAEIAADHQRRAGLRDVRGRLTAWRTLWERTRNWSECDDLIAVAQSTVDDLQRHIGEPAGWRRTALVLDRGVRRPAWRLTAVAGATLIDRQGEIAHALERLAARTALAGRAERLGDVPAEIAKHVAAHAETNDDALWHEYVEASAVRGMMIVPWSAAWIPPRSNNEASVGSAPPRLRLTLDAHGSPESAADGDDDPVDPRCADGSRRMDFRTIRRRDRVGE
ncbi:MAG: hypothetical protein QM811_08210 [Pirellulales bacterium]